MRRDLSIWISGLLFALLIFLGPLWVFPSLQNQLTTKAETLPSYEVLMADDGYLEWHGRNAYLHVAENYDKDFAEKAADQINLITGVRDVTIIYDPTIPPVEVLEPEETNVGEDTQTDSAPKEGTDANNSSDDQSSVTDSTTTDSETEGEAAETESSEVEATEEEVAQVEEAVEAILEFSTIEFETGTADLTDGSQDAIIEIAAALKANDQVNLMVVGHTDSQGDDDKNMALSLDRATSVVEALIEEGVNEDQLASEGKGESEPIASNDTAEGRKLNRRVEFIGMEN